MFLCIRQWIFGAGWVADEWMNWWLIIYTVHGSESFPQGLAGRSGIRFVGSGLSISLPHREQRGALPTSSPTGTLHLKHLCGYVNIRHCCTVTRLNFQRTVVSEMTILEISLNTRHISIFKIDYWRYDTRDFWVFGLCPSLCIVTFISDYRRGFGLDDWIYWPTQY
jgi:hypothetical protein